MNIVIRTDASLEIGTGHVMRCLTLADQLRAKGAVVSFISRELPGNLCDMLEEKGYRVYRLPADGQCLPEAHEMPPHDRLFGATWETDGIRTQRIMEQQRPPATWLIVDHYALDRRWETRMRPFTGKILVIDDLAERPHDCDVLLDQNLYRNMETRYDGLVPAHCKKLLGPSHALLRPEFIDAKNNLRARDGRVRRILVFFGGSDPTNETTKALEALSTLKHPYIAVDVVVGNTNPYKEQIRQRCSQLFNTSFHCQVNNMAQLMASADLLLGAGGTTTWERCSLGLPGITLIVAQNQRETTDAVAGAGAAWNLGWREQVSVQLLRDAVERALSNARELKNMSACALDIMGGRQTVSADELINTIVEDQYASS